MVCLILNPHHSTQPQTLDDKQAGVSHGVGDDVGRCETRGHSPRSCPPFTPLQSYFCLFICINHISRHDHISFHLCVSTRGEAGKSPRMLHLDGSRGPEDCPLPTSMWSRPEPVRDCLMCAMFARQRYLFTKYPTMHAAVFLHTQCTV